MTPSGGSLTPSDCSLAPCGNRPVSCGDCSVSSGNNKAIPGGATAICGGIPAVRGSETAPCGGAASRDVAVDHGNGVVGALARAAAEFIAAPRDECVLVAAAELRHEWVSVAEMGSMHKCRELKQVLDGIFVT